MKSDCLTAVKFSTTELYPHHGLSVGKGFTESKERFENLTGKLETIRQPQGREANFICQTH